MNIPYFTRGVALVLAAVVVAALLMACPARPGAPTVVTDQRTGLATVPNNKTIADFSLVDQNGLPWRFYDQASPLTLVSFLYTHCTDVCPFAALTMKLARDKLGDRAKDVRMVAITTDPERDTPATVAAYSAALHLQEGWTFLTGSQAQLEPVWRDFGVAVSKTDAHDAEETAKHAGELGLELPAGHAMTGLAASLPASEKTLGEQVAGKFGGGYEVTHTVPYLIVDQQGRLLALLGPETTPAELSDALSKALEASPQ